MRTDVRNEHGQPMGTVEKTILDNGNIGFHARTSHSGDYITTLTEGAARFWLWLLDERFRSQAVRAR